MVRSALLPLQMILQPQFGIDELRISDIFKIQSLLLSHLLIFFYLSFVSNVRSLISHTETCVYNINQLFPLLADENVVNEIWCPVLDNFGQCA